MRGIWEERSIWIGPGSVERAQPQQRYHCVDVLASITSPPTFRGNHHRNLTLPHCFHLPSPSILARRWARLANVGCKPWEPSAGHWHGRGSMLEANAV